MVHVLNITGGGKKYEVLKWWIVQDFRRVSETRVNGAQMLFNIWQLLKRILLYKTLQKCSLRACCGYIWKSINGTALFWVL